MDSKSRVKRRNLLKMDQSTDFQSSSNSLASQEVTLEVMLEGIIFAFENLFERVFDMKKLTQSRKKEARKEAVLVSQDVAENFGGEQKEEDICQLNGNFQNVLGKAATEMDYQKNWKEISEESFVWTGDFYRFNIFTQKQRLRDTVTYSIKIKKTRKRLLRVSDKNKFKMVKVSDGKAGGLLLPEVNGVKGTQLTRRGIG